MVGGKFGFSAFCGVCIYVFIEFIINKYLYLNNNNINVNKSNNKDIRIISTDEILMKLK